MNSIQTSGPLYSKPSPWDVSLFRQLPKDVIKEIVKKMDFPALEQLEATDSYWAKYALEEWRSIAKQIGCPLYKGTPKAQVYGFIKDLREKITNCPEKKPNDIAQILSKTAKTLTIPEIKLLQDCLKARNTLVVWAQLAGEIDEPMPKNKFDDSKALIDEAKKFSSWFTEHEQQLSQLTTLDLSGMRLTSLPSEIGKLNGLETLFLQINGLSSLPPEFAELKQLKELNLSENKFIRMPEEIGKLPKQVINLDDNPMPQLMLEQGYLDVISNFQNLGTFVSFAECFVVACGVYNLLPYLEML